MLKQKTQLGFVALIVGAVCTFSGCSKEQSPSPASSTIAANTDLQIANGRLVFVDVNAFQKIQEGLWKKNSQELSSWEQSLNFHSLRAVHSLSKDLETPDLMTEFGFPMQYATLINPAGEYQIGNKIFWFHQGYKYVASSEEELQRIKKDNSLATEKTRAGIVPMSVKKGSFPATQNRTVRNLYSSNGDGKYPYGPFPLWNDNRSLRKLSFETFLYYEDVTQIYPTFSVGYTNAVRTGVVINEYYEYYSFGRGRWYRADDERTTSYDLNITGSASNPNFAPYAPSPILLVGRLGESAGSGVGHIVGTNIRHSGGDFQLGVASAVLFSQGYGFQPIIWDYEITGTYSAYVSSDPGHTHTESGVLW